MSELPKGWFKTQLGKLIELKYGKSLPANLRDGNGFPVYGSNGVVGFHSIPLVKGGGLIIGRKGSFGEVHICEQDFSPIDTTYYVDEIPCGNKKYWFYQLFKLPLNKLNRSTAIPGLNRDDAYEQEILLPPEKEQTRIVEKLDEVLAQVDTIKARLDGIPAILKRFRQSVLAAAVSGRLTDSEISNWQTLPLSLAASHIVDCPHSTPKWSEKNTGKYCVRTTAFQPFKLDMADQGFVTDEIYLDRISRLKPLPGDILYSREGTVGIACQIPPKITLCLGQRMVLIRAGDKTTSSYLEIVLNSNFILEIVKSLTIGSTVPRINMSDIRAYPIPIPPIDEQKEIVRLVEQFFAFADTIEAQVKKAQTRVDNLTQSILAKAFRGELVAQDPNDEPAEKLLERIAQARKEAEALAKAAKKVAKTK